MSSFYCRRKRWRAQWIQMLKKHEVRFNTVKCPTSPAPPWSWSSCCVSPSWICGWSFGRGRPWWLCSQMGWHRWTLWYHSEGGQTLDLIFISGFWFWFIHLLHWCTIKTVFQDGWHESHKSEAKTPGSPHGGWQKYISFTAPAQCLLNEDVLAILI